MTRFLVQFLLSIIMGTAVVSHGWRLPSWSRPLQPARTVAGKMAAAAGLLLGTVALPTPPAHALGLSDFLVKLEGGKEIKRVVFNGVNPKTATVTYADGTTALLDEMPFDDPKGPSGPAQLIAKCQHTPGVQCSQDISDALKLAKTRSSYLGKQLNTLIESNTYPKEFSPANAAAAAASPSTAGGAAAATATTLAKEYL